jgi:hypothetical protein
LNIVRLRQETTITFPANLVGSGKELSSPFREISKIGARLMYEFDDKLSKEASHLTRKWVA